MIVGGPATTALAAGPAFSGIAATADTAETFSSTPAGMTRLKRSSLYGNPMILYPRSETRITIGDTGRERTIGDDSWIALPGLCYVRPLGEEWAFDIGPNASMGLGAT